VERLASLLKQKPEQVNTALEEGGIGEMIDNFESSHEVYTKEDFSTFQTNLEAQIEQKWLDDKVPKRVYDKIKGVSYEVIEKELAKEHGIEAWKNMGDLVIKIKDKSAKNPEDVTELKTQITRLVSDHEAREKELIELNDKRFINSQLDQIVNSVPIDAEGKVLANNRKMLKTLIMAEFDFGVEADALKILNAPVEFKQKNLDPKPPLDVVVDFAKDYVSLSSSVGGGRGDISSTAKTSKVNFPEYAKAKGIKPNSPEMATAMKEFREQGVEMIY